MENSELIRSMSKKGCSPDNSALQEFMDILEQYIYWYAEGRIKVSPGGMSPIQYRKMQDIAVQVQKISASSLGQL